MKYSFIIPYIDRLPQFRTTLYSFFNFYQARDDFEIIVVLDGKTKNIEGLGHLLQRYTPHLRIKLVGGLVNGYNPASLYNLGVIAAQGKFLILTSPECMHSVDVLKGLDNEYAETSNKYVVCSCMNVGANLHAMSWFQHSVYRNVGYHFCTAISKENYLAIGGFDKAFGPGYCFDDDDFKIRVFNANPSIDISYRDDLVVKHQSHSKVYINSQTKARLWNRNKKLFESKHGRYIEPPTPYKIERPTRM